MRTKTNAPAQVARVITVALLIVLMAVSLAITQLNLDRRDGLDPNLKGSCDQTIMPTSRPQVAPR